MKYLHKQWQRLLVRHKAAYKWIIALWNHFFSQRKTTKPTKTGGKKKKTRRNGFDWRSPVTYYTLVGCALVILVIIGLTSYSFSEKPSSSTSTADSKKVENKQETPPVLVPDKKWEVAGVYQAPVGRFVTIPVPADARYYDFELSSTIWRQRDGEDSARLYNPLTDPKPRFYGRVRWYKFMSGGDTPVPITLKVVRGR